MSNEPNELAQLRAEVSPVIVLLKSHGIDWRDPPTPTTTSNLPPSVPSNLSKDFAAYQNDEPMRSAVERQFDIPGEALKPLSCLNPAMAARIPELQRIVAFSNILIHGHASVDDRPVWGVIESQ